MAEKGLGTGLGALFGNAAVEFAPNDFEYLPIAKVEPRKEQPRSFFDEEGLEALADSIREHGVLQPLTVRKLGGGYYQIIAGERRWRAARLAGLDEVPARVIDADDRKATELALVENLQREGLNPVEEAMGYRVLMSDYGMTQEEAAQKVSKSRPAISNALRLLTLPEEVLAMLEKGELAPGAARALLSLKDEALVVTAAITVAQNGMSVRETEAYVKKLNGGTAARKKAGDRGIIVNYTEEVERQLTSGLGRKVKVVNGKRKGRIELEYYGAEDFESLLTALTSLVLKKEHQ